MTNTAIIITIIIIIIIILCLSIFLINKKNIKKKTNIIRILGRQAARWAIAASQDESIMVAVLHANYGAAYLWALKDIASDNDIEKELGVSRLEFENRITKIQDKATQRLTKACPDFLKNGKLKIDNVLLTVAGDIQ